MSVPEHPTSSILPAVVTTAPRSAGEGVPSTWDDARDGAFFRITAALFPAGVALAMSVLLASYDVDPSSTAAGARG